MSLNVRISHKFDSYENWMKSTIGLNKGELAICEIPAQQTADGMTPPAIGIKVGVDGVKTFSQLDWIQATAGDVYSWAKAAKKPEYSAEEIVGLEAFIAGEIQDTNTTYTFEFVDDKLVVKSREKGAVDAEGNPVYVEVAKLDVASSVKMDKVITKDAEGNVTSTGNLVQLDAEGNAVDSGEKIGDFLKSAAAAETYATIANLEKSDENISKLDGRLTTAEGEIGTLQQQIQGLTGAMHFEGPVQSDPTAEGFVVTGYEPGDVVVWGDKEYVFHNGVFHELGDVSAEGTRLTALEQKVGEPAAEGKDATGLIKRADDAEAAIAALEEDSHVHANEEELKKIADGDVAKWNAAEQNAKNYADAELAKEAKAREDADKALQDRAKALEDTVNGTEGADGLVKKVADNAAAIEGLGEDLSETDGIARNALQSISGVAGTKTGTDFKVTGVSTDLLTQGAATLILDCGTASLVI